MIGDVDRRFRQFDMLDRLELDYLRAFRGVFTPSQSLTPTVDFNNDGTVDGADVAVVYNAWGTLTSANVANVTGDRNVDGADLAAVVLLTRRR